MKNDTENAEKLTPMLEQYFAVKKQNPDYLLFYRMGDFYEMFFEDAIKAAAALDITLTKRGKKNGKDVPMCGVPFHSYEGYLARLIKQGFKVAICEQTEDPAEAKKRGSQALVNRDVIRLITPGTLTEDNLLKAGDSNFLAALCDLKGVWALAWTDMSTGDFNVQTLPCSAAALSGALARLSPKEILLPEKMLKTPDLFELFNDYKKELTPLPDVRFSFENGQKRLETFFNVATLDSFGVFENAEIAAAGALLDYINLTQKGAMPRLNRLKQTKTSAIMEIDAATRRNLEIFDSLSGDRSHTLFACVNRTVTGAGARLLAGYLAAPLTDLKEIDRRLDRVDFFVQNPLIRENVRDCLRECPDIERTLSRLSVGRGSPRDLGALRAALTQLPAIKKALSEKIGEETALTAGLPESLAEFLSRFDGYESLTKLLCDSLAQDLPYLARDGGFIARGYNAELDSLKELRDESRSLIAKLQAGYAAQTGVATLKISHNNILGYYIEVPAKAAQKMLDDIRNGDTVFIHRQTMANAVRFTTKELAELENKMQTAGEKALAMELEMFDSLVRAVLKYAENLAATAHVLAVTDAAAGAANTASAFEYTRPVLDDTFGFEIVKGRHPVIEKAMRESGAAGEFVANDCCLEDNRENGRLWLLTGPNMAGKSTFLRQNALIAVLAQSGCFVPAEFARIGIVDKLFSRVGASDDLARGRSTFMVEMVETAAILNRSTERSFVILDEIGRGTATYDGLSIAWAVVEYLHETNKCRALFATHYHELTALKEKLNRLSLHTMRVKEWKNNVVFLHEVVSGALDRSYGIHVGKLAGLPAPVIARAKQVLVQLEKKGSYQVDFMNDLPLFARLPKQEEPQPEEDPAETPRVVERLRALNPDDLTPKQALELLYELKKEA